MLQRCHNERDKDFVNYGGRGIGVCARWRNSFENFLADMGERPQGHSIDRINNNKGYGPKNCRWATITQQNRNKRGVKLNAKTAAEIRGSTQRRAELAKRFGVSVSAIGQVITGKLWL